VSVGSVDVAWHARRPELASPIIAAGAVWAIDNSGTLFALDPASGSVVYSVGLGSAQHFSTPAATEGFVVVPAGKNVVAVSTSR
jgi:outer membrane protein assembly factor BamB